MINLKQNLYVLLALQAFATALFAQNVYPDSIVELTPQKLSDLLKGKPQVVDGPLRRRNLMTQAGKAARLDLMQVFFADPNNAIELANVVRDLPQGDIRYRATIMMLRTEQQVFWPNEGQFMTLTGGMAVVGAFNHEKEPFTSIPKLLPEVKNLKARLSTSVERRKLADEMEAALAKLQEQAEPSLNEAQSAAVQTKPLPSIPSVPSGSPLPSKDNTSKQRLEAAEAHNGAGFFWLIGLSVAAVGAVWWSSRRGNK